MKMLAALCLALLATPAFADNRDDELACAAHTTELVHSVSSKFYEVVRNQMIDEIGFAYRAQGAPINETQISFSSEKIEPTVEFWGLQVSLEASVSAGNDSAVFTVVSKMQLSGSSNLTPRAFRDTRYDSIGRVVSTRLLCTLTSANPTWAMPLLNKATGFMVDNHYASGDVSAQLVLP